MNIQIVGIIGGGILLILLITLLIIAKCTKNSTIKKFAENIINVFGAVLLKMTDIENFTNLSSDEKKAVCLMKIQDYCEKNKIDTKNIDIDSVVEFFIKISYSINSDEAHKNKLNESEEKN